MFRKAIVHVPDDQQSWNGLGQALEARRVAAIPMRLTSPTEP
jgi:hypothetical protein